MKKLVFLLYFTAIAVFISKAQLNDSVVNRKNVVKINIVALGIKNYSLTYERSLGNRSSFLFGVSYLPKSQIRALGFLPKYLFKVQQNKLTGYSLTPELRKYFVKCQDEDLVAGLYISGYLRYAHYNVNTILVDKVIGYDARANLGAVYNELGLGVQLGYQIIVLDRFTFDIVAFGPRLSQYWLNVKLDVHGEEDIPEKVEEFLNETFDNFRIPDEVNFSEEFKYKSSFTYANFRYMLCLGYRF